MQESNVFRMSKKLFYIDVVSSIILFIVIIGIPILIAFIIRYLFMSITVGDNSVEFKKGWLNTTHRQIPYDKINSVDVKIGLMGRFLGYGDVRVFTGNDVEGIKFQGIENPHELRRQIEAHAARTKTGGNVAAISKNTPSNNVANELTKLAKLKQQGILTQEEFDKKKAQLLS
jgi:uncharacterized membrane protein YdbT with pleckstrin-like domain